MLDMNITDIIGGDILISNTLADAVVNEVATRIEDGLVVNLIFPEEIIIPASIIYQIVSPLYATFGCDILREQLHFTANNQWHNQQLRLAIEIVEQQEETPQ